MGKREGLSQFGSRVTVVVVVFAVDMWAVIVPSTYPQRIVRTLRNRLNDLTEFTEKILHNLNEFHDLFAVYQEAAYLIVGQYWKSDIGYL
jgi:hypothetical protein